MVTVDDSWYRRLSRHTSRKIKLSAKRDEAKFAVRAAINLIPCDR